MIRKYTYGLQRYSINLLKYPIFNFTTFKLQINYIFYVRYFFMFKYFYTFKNY